MSDPLNDIREALNGSPVRIEFSFAFSASGTHQSAQVYRQQGAKWAKVGPFIIPPDGGTRVDLLDMFANLAREQQTTPAAEREGVSAK